MNSIGYYFGLSKATEVLILTILGICYTIFDASILNLNSNLNRVWTVPLDEDKFSDRTQLLIKYMLSGIILVRTFSIHLYLAFYIVMLWPAIFEERPNLLLPWLTVGTIRSLMMGLLSFSIGSYACLVYGMTKPACLDFVLAQLIENAPSMYAWLVVLRELKSEYASNLSRNADRSIITEEVAIRRRLARTINPDLVLDKSKQLINESRSLDSLLLKLNTESYTEDTGSSEDFGTEEDIKIVSLVEKAVKALEITKSDIERAKRGKDISKQTEDLISFFENAVANFSKDIKRSDDSIQENQEIENSLFTQGKAPEDAEMLSDNFDYSQEKLLMEHNSAEELSLQKNSGEIQPREESSFHYGEEEIHDRNVYEQIQVDYSNNELENLNSSDQTQNKNDSNENVEEQEEPREEIQLEKPKTLDQAIGESNVHVEEKESQITESDQIKERRNKGEQVELDSSVQKMENGEQNLITAEHTSALNETGDIQAEERTLDSSITDYKNEEEIKETVNTANVNFKDSVIEISASEKSDSVSSENPSVAKADDNKEKKSEFVLNDLTSKVAIRSSLVTEEVKFTESHSPIESCSCDGCTNVPSRNVLDKAAKLSKPRVTGRTFDSKYIADGYTQEYLQRKNELQIKDNEEDNNRK